MDPTQDSNQLPSQNINPPKPAKSKRLLVIIVLVVVLLVVGILVVKISQRSKPSDEQNSLSTIPVAAAQVAIKADGFSPATIKIKKGQIVEWTNQDDKPHQVASDPHPTHSGLQGLDGEPQLKGSSYSFGFERTGSYTYHDHQNPLKFRGTVIVE